MATLYVISGAPGSGKSTIIPFLFARPGQVVAVAVPTRVSAISLAEYVASRIRGGMYQLPEGLHPDTYRLVSALQNPQTSPVADGGCIPFDGEVGYAVRGNKIVDLFPSPGKAKIVYATTGILIQHLVRFGFQDLFLIVDEAHLRSVEADILIGLAIRSGVDFAVMSATMEEEIKKLSDLSASHSYSIVTLSTPAPDHGVMIYEFPEQSWLLFQKPVTAASRFILNCLPRLEYRDTVVNLSDDYLLVEHKGQPLHALVFMPGAGEAESLAEILRNHLRNEVITLYGAMSIQELTESLEKIRKRDSTRIIVATNMVSVSVTLNAGLVIDTGIWKQGEDQEGFKSLQPDWIPKTEANQRAGRAGRTAPGICLRLYDFSTLPDVSVPEILRMSSERVVLVCSALSIDPTDFPFIDAPPQDRIWEAYRQLQILGAIDESGAITTLGMEVLQLGLPARLAIPLIYARSGRWFYLESLVLAISLLATDRPWKLPLKDPQNTPEWSGYVGDLESGLEALKSFVRLARSMGLRGAAKMMREKGYASRVLEEAATIYFPDLAEKLGLSHLVSDGLPKIEGPIADERSLGNYLFLGFRDQVAEADWERGVLIMQNGEMVYPDRLSTFFQRYGDEKPNRVVVLSGVRRKGRGYASVIVPFDSDE